MRQLLSFLASLTVHLAVALFLFLPSCSTVKPPPPPLKSQDKLTVVRLLPAQEPSITETAPKKSGRTWTGDDCPDKSKMYEGIGMVFSFFTDKVLEVPPSLPAYKAGIRVGDVFVNPMPNGTNGIRDGWAEYDFYRGDKRFSVRIKLEKICFEAPKPAATGTVPHQ